MCIGAIDVLICQILMLCLMLCHHSLYRCSSATFNRWLVNGNTKSRCFDVDLGWFRVSFLGEQVLHGTYGGTEGRKVASPATSRLTLLYEQIDTCPQSPVVILVKPTAPASRTPDGLVFEPGVASHRILGSGISLLTLLS